MAPSNNTIAAALLQNYGGDAYIAKAQIAAMGDVDFKVDEVRANQDNEVVGYRVRLKEAAKAEDTGALTGTATGEGESDSQAANAAAAPTTPPEHQGSSTPDAGDGTGEPETEDGEEE